VSFHESDSPRREDEPDAAPRGESTAVCRSSPRLLIWALALTAGLAAGSVAWLVGEAVHDRFQPRLLATGGIPSIEEARAGEHAMRSALTLQAAVAFGLLGSALGASLGLAGGGVRRSARSSLIGGAFGAILGGVAGAVASFALLPVYFQFYDPDRDDLPLALLIQGGIAAAVGAVGGAAFGMGDRGRVSRALLGGLVGAVAGVLIYEVVGALAFPLDQTTKPISATPASRLLGRIIVATLASAGTAMGYASARGIEVRPDGE
jgi:hypothetical protein